MRGEIKAVWSETWREIWFPLVDIDEIPDDIFCELYRELEPALKVRPSTEKLAEIVASGERSRAAFAGPEVIEFSSEAALVASLEKMHSAIEELGGDALSNRYFNMLESFIQKYSLRYDLRRPCMLCPTLPGVFASLIQNLRSVSQRDAHLAELMHAFEEAVRDLRYNSTEVRIKTCMNKQFMLLEALGALAPDVTKHTLGDMCDELKTWPHATVRESLKKVYGFASNYPGIRHAGVPAGKIRNIEMRDMIAMSILLTGFTPYLNDEINADATFWGL